LLVRSVLPADSQNTDQILHDLRRSILFREPRLYYPEIDAFLATPDAYPDDLSLLAGVDATIEREYDCLDVVQPGDPDTTLVVNAGFAVPCGPWLASALPTDGSSLTTALARWEPLDFARDGSMFAELAADGIGPGGVAVDGIHVDQSAACGADVDHCLQASPLQVATALAALAALDQRPGQVPRPYLLTQREPAPAGALVSVTALSKLGPAGTREIFNVPLPDGGLWSVRFVPPSPGHGRAVIVAFVPSTDGWTVSADDRNVALTSAVASSLTRS